MLKCVVVFLLLACSFCSAKIKKQTLDPETGALCLDGTPGIYYFKEGSTANKTKWVFHLLGGGMCMSDEECLYRTHGPVGSSNNSEWTDEYEYGGPISEDPSYNPDFYDWNHAFFVYCDGASFSGDREEPVKVNDTYIYYRGHRILTGIMNDLLLNHDLNDATHVLVVGDSAGGMATYYHVDEIKSMLPNTTIFKAAPFSGVFLDLPNVEGKVFFRDLMKGVFESQDCYSNDKCINAQKKGEEWKCFFAQYVMDYIETPLFVLNSRIDLIGLMCISLGEPLHGLSNGT